MPVDVLDLVRPTEDTKGTLQSVFTSDNANFKVITTDKIREIANGMTEMHRAMQSFSKTNSQATSALMTLNMMTGGPYRVLRQILAEVNKKKSALKGAYYSFNEKIIRAKKLRARAKNTKDPLDSELYAIQAESLESQALGAKDAVEACLKEIGMYQEAYNQIREAHGIRENWDEVDFEKAEVEHHIRCAFRNAVRDMMATGRANHGTMEYLEQFGINPVQAYRDVDAYLRQFQNNDHAGINDFYKFLDDMVKKYSEAWKAAANRLGLKSITFEHWLYTEDK